MNEKTDDYLDDDVDDYKENIEACEKVGITGYHFDQDAGKLKSFIQTH